MTEREQRKWKERGKKTPNHLWHGCYSRKQLSVLTSTLDIHLHLSSYRSFSAKRDFQAGRGLPSPSGAARGIHAVPLTGSSLLAASKTAVAEARCSQAGASQPSPPPATGPEQPPEPVQAQPPRRAGVGLSPQPSRQTVAPARPEAPPDSPVQRLELGPAPSAAPAPPSADGPARGLSGEHVAIITPRGEKSALG